MIDYEQTAELLALAAARDQRTVGDADVLAWHEDLNAARVDHAEARSALARFYQEMATRPVQERYRVTPVDVIDIARRARRERLANYRYEPPPGSDTDPNYLARLRGEIAAVANGTAAPPPLTLHSGPTPALVAARRSIGRPVSAEDDPAEDKPKRSLGVQCPKCRARIGQHCKWPGGGRRPTHHARTLAAEGDTGQDDTATRTAAERKQAAAAALNRLTPAQRAELDRFEQQLHEEAS